MDKKRIEEAVKSALGGSFAGFDENPDEPRSCFIGVYENIENSKWRGEWTERIRLVVRETTPSATCVCVKPQPIDGVVWYSIDIA